jgi:hypothetical protein
MDAFSGLLIMIVVVGFAYTITRSEMVKYLEGRDVE